MSDQRRPQNKTAGKSQKGTDKGSSKANNNPAYVAKKRPYWRRRPKNVFGAIDLGTNNCRLLVAHPTKSGFRVVDAFSRIVRLGEGLSKHGELSQDAISRTIDALHICVEKMNRQRVTHMRNVATQACREAKNCDEFVERVEKEVRIKLDIIDPQEEARLAVLGCKALLHPKYQNAIVFDIGGGSTELIWLKIADRGQPIIIDWMSVPFGVVNLSEKYGTQDVIADQDYLAMKTLVLDALRSFEIKNKITPFVEQGKVQLLGTSGTVTTLTSMHLDLQRYDRNQVDGSWVYSNDMQNLCTELAGMNYQQRANRNSIGPDRAELVVAGCAILEAIMELWPIEQIRVADRGIREGMLLDLIDKTAYTKKRSRRSNNRNRNNRNRFRKKSGNQSGSDGQTDKT